MKDKTKLEDGKIAIITELGFDQLNFFIFYSFLFIDWIL